MLIDLTLPIDEQDTHNPFFKQQHAINVSRLGHLGTHLDIMHVDTANLAPERFITPAILIHVENIYQRPIELSDIPNLSQIAAGDFVIFKTDWFDTYYRSEFYVKGHPEAGHPELSDEVLETLIERKVNFIGIDAAGIKKTEGHAKADTYCADHDVFVIENIVNLARLSQDRFKLYCFPLNLKKVSGLPVRLIAEL